MPEDLATAMRRKRRALARLVAAAENESAEEGRKLAAALSDGPLSLARLAAMGHPYARHHLGRGAARAVDPETLNRQSGRLQRAWRVRRCRNVGGGARFWTRPAAGRRLLTQVLNLAPEARFMLGTGVMVPRRIDERVAREIQHRRLDRLRRALKTGLRA